MKNLASIFFIVLIFMCFNVNGQDILVSNIIEYNNAIKLAKPGTIIILKNGIWVDVELNAFGKGTVSNPINIKAETPGKVLITGNSRLNIYGEYIIVSGLWFKDGHSSFKSVVQFKKDSKTFANHCRFTNSTISYFTVDTGIKDHWVDIWGKNNRVDHNNFTGKTSPGTTLVVWLKGEEHIENNHRIDNNLFGFRDELGTNGGETIRIGTSTNSKKSSKTLVEKNVFESCNGEIEIISNKSGDNIYRDNLFIGSKGALTLRHGDNALVERNVFLGNGVSKTGGIRVINSNHIIRNNLFFGLEGDGYRGPIVVMNGVVNSPLNRYEQVKNVDIQNNTIINCGPISFGAGKDTEKTLSPINTIFSNNLIVNNKLGENILFVDSVNGITFKNNYIDALTVQVLEGFKATKVDWKAIGSLLVPSADNSDLLVVTKSDKSYNWDIVNNLRKIFNAGAFNLDATKLPKALKLRAGTGWTPKIVLPIAKAKEITVTPGIETLRKAIDKATAGSILYLMDGTYLLEKKIKINKNITIIGAKKGTSIISAKKVLEKPIDYLFRIQEGVTLNISHITLDGENSHLKYAIVSPDKQENGLYNLFADAIVFQNFTNTNGGSVFKAYKGTKADTLSFINSRFENNYKGLNLSYDKDIMGKYNANTIILENSIFINIEEAAVNYTRKTLSSEITGGNLIIKNCIFSKVYNQEKGKIIVADGIYKVEISNSVFENSYKVKSPVRLVGSNSSISNCLIHNSGFVEISKRATKKNVIYKNPKWKDHILFIPSDTSKLLKKNNTIDNIGLKL